MGEQIIFRCNECGFYFRSSDEGIETTEEYFCSCGDKTFENSLLDDADTIPEASIPDGALGRCTECKEDFRKRVTATCPGCQAKNLKIQGTISFFQ